MPVSAVISQPATAITGFIGATDDLLAIRAISSIDISLLQVAVGVPLEHRSAHAEWVIGRQYRPAVASYAGQMGLQILPEARRLVGLSPGRPILLPQLVPSTAWYSNLRNHLKPRDWQNLSRRLRAAAGGRCELCGRIGKKHPTECHELWAYDEVTGIQSLDRLLTLCPWCHRCYHLGLAQVSGWLPSTLRHWATVNGWDSAKVQQEHRSAMQLWEQRSQRSWHLRFDRLSEYGMQPPAPESAQTRADNAKRKAQVEDVAREVRNRRRGFTP